MPTALVVSGSGRWADPWHPFEQTSERLRQVLAGTGLEVTVRDDVEDALTGLPAVDLLVLNIGNTEGPDPDVPDLPERPGPEVVAAIESSLQQHLERGGALLGVHSATTALPSSSTYASLLGGRWVRGRTMHPPIGPARVEPVDVDHPVAAGLGPIELVDERYSWLETGPDVTVLCEHEHDEEQHPVVWARTAGPARVLYSGLGHDARSYDSPAHRELLVRGAGWLLDRRG
ncbi:ThuA domain-containing protein [Desertihabitans aurantiacus]|uniref:ThuA domain-containing protein n=1 Tax=Desertihabitans aurantiacus TaxID=2282477 RepID=UPI0013004031|nr:ThuA domain-containing protein [Desertihabitans aurantiacus]